MITLQIESPDKKEIIELIEQLDAYQVSLYPPESNHLLDINSLIRNNVIFLTVKDDDKYIGCGALKFAGKDYAEVKRMYVLPGQRGKGIGNRILQELENIALASGIKMLRLETGIHQHEAIKLYERFGFYKIDPFDEYKEDPLSLFFEKKIG